MAAEITITRDTFTVTLDTVGQVFQIKDDTGDIFLQYTAGDYFVEVKGPVRESGGETITD